MARVQLLSQPSPSVVLPSSHSSQESWTPSPHVNGHGDSGSDTRAESGAGTRVTSSGVLPMKQSESKNRPLATTTRPGGSGGQLCEGGGKLDASSKPNRGPSVGAESAVEVDATGANSITRGAEHEPFWVQANSAEG